jgi:hypothetical protein
MALVIVEREFEVPQDFAEIQAAEDRHGWCLEARGVVFVRSYFSRDHRRMICLYEAPDAESVREAQREAGLPFSAVWTAQTR